MMNLFWALGAFFEVLLAFLVMPTLGWKWLLGLSAIPILTFALCCSWLPESVRFNVAAGKVKKAEATLQQVAKDNRKVQLSGRLVVEGGSGSSDRGRLKDLLGIQLRRTSLLLWLIWVMSAFCYYGVVLLTTELFRDSSGPVAEEDQCSVSCKQLSSSQYLDILWTTLAEFPGTLVTLAIIERFGRKKTMAALHLLYAFFVFFILFSLNQRPVLTFVLFGARGLTSGVFQAAYVYTPEVYPTALRSVGVGACSAMARIGAMSTPFVAQVLVKTSVPLAVGVYSISGVLAAVACFFLPFETKGREMKDNIH